MITSWHERCQWRIQVASTLAFNQEDSETAGFPIPVIEEDRSP